MVKSHQIRSREDYFIPGTTVLRNKFTETDPERLQAKEEFAAQVRLAELAEHPIRGNFDYAHMKAIHRAIFQDIYDWAGFQELLRQMHHSPVLRERSEASIDEMTPA